MARLKRTLRFVAILAGLAACAPAPAPLVVPAGGEPVAAIHVVSNGWHSGLVLARSDLGTESVPEAADFPDAHYLEFGWGDREYYPNPRPTLGMALAAIATPSPAIMHVAGLTGPPETARAGDEVIALGVSAEGLAGLVAAIDASFERPEAGPARPVAAGLYPGSRFYPAKGSFHLFNTCNTWIARMLAAAGLDIAPSGIVTAEDLMSKVRALPGAAVLRP
ncbi:MAG: DUF2459 domain-containing protein [Alphaproteobacteria bacterium]